MRINFYEAILTEDDRTALVKEKGVNYASGEMNSPAEIAQMMRDLLHMQELAEEHIYMVAMNSKNKVIGVFFISRGTVSASLISPREIFMRAMLIGAVQIILCHNHPSGNISPSECDLELTKRVKDAGILLNICLTDHIIIGKDQYLSLREANLL